MLLEDRLIEEVKRLFGDDQKRIDHALTVFGYASEIMKAEGGDPKVVVSAALLHDIGIKEAERKHGSSAAKYQEMEGPRIAEGIMRDVGLDADTIDHVCRIVGSHHSARDIDTVEFRIIWDADWIVNIPDLYDVEDKGKLAGVIKKLFRTKSGREIAEGKYL
ncbi:MAG: HD domain-containing protein [Deltaproteobacteria bacterium]|uniref:HD domain-containing protein n=1 Tax=Candidatus Zymogenus saltonus TaxID=2844893 RepID=A0A9D8KJG1_9DELT|nr:HD domain-containing protein [Candidatus Zymogenus saltonus]